MERKLTAEEEKCVEYLKTMYKLWAEVRAKEIVRATEKEFRSEFELTADQTRQIIQDVL